MLLASSTSDLSGTAVSSAAHVSGLPDPIDGRSQYVVNSSTFSKRIF